MNNLKKIFVMPLMLIIGILFECVPLFAVEVYDSTNIAAIQIKPYCPDGIFPPSSLPITSSLPEIPHDQSQHFRRYISVKKAGEPNEALLNKTFSYIKKDELSAESTNNLTQLMSQLVSKYNSFREITNLNSNVLFVKMRVTAKPHILNSAATNSNAPISPPVTHDYFLGLFVSGSQDFKGGTVRDLAGSLAVPSSSTSTNSESSMGAKSQKKNQPNKSKVGLDFIPTALKKAVEYEFFSNLWTKPTFLNLLKEHAVLKTEEGLTKENAEELLSENVYSIKLFNFELQGQKRNFAFISNERFGDLSHTMNSRLFTFVPVSGEEPPHKLVLHNCYNAPPTVTKSKELDEAIQREKGMVNRIVLTAGLFKKPLYDDRGELKACLRKESDLDYCFGQSEQAFLSWLEQWEGVRVDVNESDNLYSPSPAPGGKYEILKIDLDLYSYLDICCYCRGTIAYLLSTGKMAEILHQFLIKLKITPHEELSDNSRIAAFTSKIQINAFSYRGTDTA